MTSSQLDTPATLDFRAAPARFIDVGHSRLAYRRIGQGPDLLFVHGWPLSSATFRDIVPPLAERFTCHLLDLPGAGFSEWTRESPISIPGHVETLERAVGELGLQRYAIVAHDSGAAIGRYLAARQPERVAAIVMGNTEIPGYASPLLKLLVFLMRLPGGKLMFELFLRYRFLRRSTLGLGGCFGNKDLLDGEFHELTVSPLLDSRRAAAGQMALVDGFELSQFDGLAEVHGKIPAPVQMIWGDADSWFPIEKARAMVPQFAGGCELHLLESGKVFAHEEFPQAFAGHALPFLQRAFAGDS